MAFLDNDHMDSFRAHIIDSSKQYTKYENVKMSLLDKYNLGNDIYELIVEGQIHGIRNNNRSLFLIDTPGVNNTLDQKPMKLISDKLANNSNFDIIFDVNKMDTLRCNSEDPQDFILNISRSVDERSKL